MEEELKTYLNDKFSNVDNQLTEIKVSIDATFEIVTANGQGIETISGSLDNLEKDVKDYKTNTTLTINTMSNNINDIFNTLDDNGLTFRG